MSLKTPLSPYSPPRRHQYVFSLIFLLILRLSPPLCNPSLSPPFALPFILISSLPPPLPPSSSNFFYSLLCSLSPCPSSLPFLPHSFIPSSLCLLFSSTILRSCFLYLLSPSISHSSPSLSFISPSLVSFLAPSSPVFLSFSHTPSLIC